MADPLDWVEANLQCVIEIFLAVGVPDSFKFFIAHILKTFNMESFIAMLSCLDIFNALMGLGLVGLAVAIYRIDKDTKVMRERNRQESQRESKRQKFQDDIGIIVH